VRPYFKKTSHKNGAGGVAQDPEFKPQQCKKKKDLYFNRNSGVTKLGMIAHTYNPSTQEAKAG
jgi:hypothetical protein